MNILISLTIVFQAISRIVTMKPFTLSMLLMVPQYVLATAGEIMFSITGLEFSYSQSPRSMKSILQACWLLTVAIGNLIVVLVTEIRFFDSPADESFFFGFLMFLDILLFAALAKMYKPLPMDEESESEMVYLGGKENRQENACGDEHGTAEFKC